jgi:MYXO-CTERM domain-containing protein
MVRANTILAALCVLVLGGACTSPTPEEPARQAPKATRRALGEGPASLVDVAVKAERALVRYPESPTAAGTTLLFTANDDTLGAELWRLDATGPALVADIVPGPIGSAPSQLFHSRGLTWFAAADEAHGVELWRTDGTTAGTFLLEDIYPGPASSRPTGLAELNGWIFFSANDGEHGTELWRTDGTPEGTQLVRDISLGSGSSEPQSFTELGGRLYFLVNAPGGTRQLWRTDGTPEGTVRVGAGVTVTAVPSTRGLVRSGRTLFFAGNEATAGTELWKTDGTEAGTVRVKDLLPGATGSNPVQLTAFEGAVYFVATDGVTGRELWKTDGTEAGTQRVLELVSGNNSAEKPDSLVATSTRLFFMMRDASNTESALYATDGTAAGTSKLVDFKAAGGKGPLLMTAHGSTLYFTGYEPGVGHELWTSDGTPAGSRRIGINHFPGDRLADPAPKAFTVLGDTVYFVATAPGTGFSDENPPLPTLWRSRGDAATTVPVGTDLNPTRGSNPAPFASWDGALYFTTFEQEAAARLWRTDGTVAGTVPLVKIVPEEALPFTAESGLSALTPLNGALYFAAMPSLAEGFQLWKTNGTPVGTTRVTTAVRLTTAASSPMELVAHGGFLFFAGQDSTHGIELWKSDGTVAGTTLVKDIAAGSGPSSRPSRFTSMGDALYFIARDASGGRELWRTDGTEANTFRVANVPDNLGMGAVMNIAGVVGSTLYFVANEASTGIELWKTDGTEATTSRVKDIAPGLLDSGPSAFAVLDGVLYFTANDGSGPELWRTDGTESGTVLVKDLSPASGGSRPGALTVLGKTLYFTADDGTSGRELWKLDTPGTEPVRVRDILPGPGSGVLAESLFVLPAENLLLFAANDGVGGTELWRSDGTGEGTFVLHDIAPWQLGSNPAGFTLFADFVAFSANDGRRGREPWIMPLSLLTDSEPPSITCPVVLPIEAQQFLGARVDFAEATASDNSTPAPAISYSHVPGSFFPFGDTVVHVTARDTAGLVDTCTFTVHVQDTTPPEPVCPTDATVEATSEGGAIITYSAPRATDAVTRAPVISVSHASGSLFPHGNTMVTVTATDEKKNSGKCTFTVRVQDTTASVVTCPADQLVEAVDATGADVTWPPAEASDGAVSRPTLTYDHVNGSRFPIGNTTVTATAKDGANNTSSCTFQVSVRDTQAPTLRCPASLRAEATGPSGAPVEYSVTNVVDNISTVALTFSHASGDTFPVGETPVRVQARDASGNVTECGFSVVVLDTLPPLLTCPQDMTIAKGPVAVQLPQPSVTDRVTASPAITFSPASGSVFQPGHTAVEVTARDDAGNSARCTFDVHIEKSSGCSAAPGSMGAAGWMGLLSLLALATRRRSLTSSRRS